MDHKKNLEFVTHAWDKAIIPALIEYVKIPNKSPQFDPEWRENGYMQQAVDLIAEWCKANSPQNAVIEVIQLENRTPVILIDVPGEKEDTILLYGHLDKQPEMTGWEEGLAPWQPVLRNNKLYGRGGADDGYAVFASLTAIRSIQAQGLPHARCVILIEACEESGSYDLPYYIDALNDRIANPGLIICLDSGCGNYEQLWATTSLRGLISAKLKIDVLSHGVHSGMGSGIVPSCFQILRDLLSRIEDQESGIVLLDELFVEIPEERINQANQTAEVLGDAVYKDLPFLENVKPRSGSTTDLLLNNTWRPALSVTGCDGMPSIAQAGNVTLPSLAVKLSMRLPPNCDSDKAAAILKETLVNDPPFDAHITCEITETSGGWNAPAAAEWLTNANQEASMHYFEKPFVCMGEGGSIPFMSMLGKKFPEAQFLITGVLGPESNAHGPNEFLHIPAAKKLTACVAEIITKYK